MRGMTIDPSTIVSLAEAQQDFSRVARIAEQEGQAVIVENNRPRYVLLDLDHAPLSDLSNDEKIDLAAARILKRYLPAFQELAK